MKDVTIPMTFYNDCMALPVTGKMVLKSFRNADDVRLCSEGLLVKKGDEIKLYGFDFREMRVHPKKLYTVQGVEIDPTKIEFAPVADVCIRKLLTAMASNLINEICDDDPKSDKVFVVTTTWLEALHWGYKIVRTIIKKAEEHHKIVIFVDGEANDQTN